MPTAAPVPSACAGCGTVVSPIAAVIAVVSASARPVRPASMRKVIPLPPIAGAAASNRPTAPRVGGVTLHQAFNSTVNDVGTRRLHHARRNFDGSLAYLQDRSSRVFRVL